MPTTEGGLPYPASTDPIRLGAQRIRELAVAVDSKLVETNAQLASSLAQIADDIESIPKGEKGDPGGASPTDVAIALEDSDGPAGVILDERILELSVSIPPTRVAVAPLSAPNTVTTLGGALDNTFRTIMKLPFDTARWRLKFRNRNLLDNTVPVGAATITSVYQGTPSRPTTTTSGQRWVGTCTAALTLLQDADVAVPNTGAWAYSEWFDDGPEQFAANSEKVISIGVTAASGQVLAKGNGYQWARGSLAANAGSAALTTGTAGVGLDYLDVCVEYEFAAAVKVLLAVGDSNTLSYVPDAPPLIPTAAAGLLPFESWPAIAGAMGGFAVINLGVGSAQTPNFDPTSVSYIPALWDRLPAGVEIDAVINSLGTNDLGSSLTTFIGQMRAINAYERDTLGIPAAWWTTITQRCFPDLSYGPGVDAGAIKAGYLQANIAAGATSFSSSTAPPTGSLLLGTGANAEDVTVSSVTGAGPYTVNVSATVNAHYAGERWGVAAERLRTYKNNFLRQIPDGILGCFDFERGVESTPGSAQIDPRYAASDWLHFQRGVSATKAGLVVGTGIAPLFG